MNSNLSKIKPKFRTSGAVSQPRRKAGSKYSDLGVTNAEKIRCATQDEYLNRMIVAYQKTTDKKLKAFIAHEIKKIQVQRGRF